METFEKSSFLLGSTEKWGKKWGKKCGKNGGKF